MPISKKYFVRLQYWYVILIKSFEAGIAFFYRKILCEIFNSALANEVVRCFSNLTAKSVEIQQNEWLRTRQALGGMTDFYSSEHIVSIK